MGTPEQRPAWLRKTEGEERWWIGLALLVAVGIQFSLPSLFVVHPAYLLPGIEVGYLLLLTFAHPERMSRREPRVRRASIVLLGLIAVTNTISLILLVHQIATRSHISAVTLLGGGAGIWITNTIVFGQLYWEFDRGGPADRANAVATVPDLLFPQMTDDHLAQDWEPIFVDYFYVSFTNSTAFSPTDTLPLSRWIKLLFALQSLISLVTVGLIIARAVNILP